MKSIKINLWYDKAERNDGMAREKKTQEQLTERKRKYDDNFIKNNYRAFLIRFNNTSESDIIEKLENTENVRQYMIRLIREDIAREKEDTN